MVKETFNQCMQGISPEQTRKMLFKGVTMVEKEKPQPTFKPALGLGQAVDNQTHKQKLVAERERLSAFREQAVAIHTQLHLEGKLVATHTQKPKQTIQAAHKLRDDFNTHVAQAHDMKELGWSY